jgi:predicted Zn-dependent protease with MMP-like domain
MPRGISRADFEQLVSEALDALPGWLQPFLDEVAVVVEDDPPEGEDDLYGLYEGPELGDDPTGFLPPMITLFRRPLVEDYGDEPAALRREVQITVAHELAHRFGFDEKRLDELGYG